MLDLIEGAKVVVGLASTGATFIAGAADYISTKNMHRVWAIATFRGAEGPTVNTRVAETYAGASASSVESASIWTCLDSSTLDRWTKSTALGTATFDDTNDGAIAFCFDPTVANTSDSYFTLAHTSGVGALHITYIGEPRYGGYRQFEATTSST
jgi:hypothetical protein